MNRLTLSVVHLLNLADGMGEPSPIIETLGKTWESESL